MSSSSSYGAAIIGPQGVTGVTGSTGSTGATGSTGGVQVLWVKTADTALNTWTTATSILGATGQGTLTIPANTLVAGKTVRLRLRGTISTVSTPAATFTFALSIQGVAVCSTGAVTATTGMSSRGWELEFDVTCRQTGSTATCVGHGLFKLNTTAQTAVAWGAVGSTTAVDINTANTAVIDVTAACGTSNASNGIRCNICTVEILTVG